WIRQRPKTTSVETQQKEPAKAKSKDKTDNQGQTRKLKFKEKRELETLPATIETLEQRISVIHTAMAEPAFYQQSSETISAQQSELKGLEDQLQESYERWEELESIENS
ncbi:MAG: ABC transporter ATP-binding protein, partial [Planctomycetota bacterium]